MDDGKLRSPTDEKKHFREFKRVSDMIEDHNALPSATYKAEYNMFAMMTEAERESHLGLNTSEAFDQQTRPPTLVSRRKPGGIPSQVNHEKQLVPPKKQGACGACWAFGASAALEYAIGSRVGEVTSVSEQMWVDCVYADQQKSGCSGGWPSKCFKWTRDNGNMIANERDYPYKVDKADRGENCKNIYKYRSALHMLKIGDVIHVGKTDKAMTEAVADMRIGVIQAGVSVPQSFFQYREGIYYERECVRVKHAVAVVGYGVKGGIPFFRVRNSWGTLWGENGHINMRRGVGGENVNTCRLTEFGYYPTVYTYWLGDSQDEKDDGGDVDRKDGEDNKDEDGEADEFL